MNKPKTLPCETCLVITMCRDKYTQVLGLELLFQYYRDSPLPKEKIDSFDTVKNANQFISIHQACRTNKEYIINLMLHDCPQLKDFMLENDNRLNICSNSPLTDTIYEYFFLTKREK